MERKEEMKRRRFKREGGRVRRVERSTEKGQRITQKKGTRQKRKQDPSKLEKEPPRYQRCRTSAFTLGRSCQRTRTQDQGRLSLSESRERERGRRHEGRTSLDSPQTRSGFNTPSRSDRGRSRFHSGGRGGFRVLARRGGGGGRQEGTRKGEWREEGRGEGGERHLSRLFRHGEARVTTR